MLAELFVARTFPFSSLSSTLHFCFRRDLQLRNLDVIVADISTFDMDATYDRIFSIEMFEVCKWATLQCPRVSHNIYLWYCLGRGEGTMNYQILLKLVVCEQKTERTLIKLMSQKTNVSFECSIWRTTRISLRRYPSGWNQIVFFLYIISAIKSLLITSRYTSFEFIKYNFVHSGKW